MTIEKVLVVDDEILVRNFLAETLKRKGLEITTAENGQKAFNLLKDFSYDLVITDMKMPDFTGLDVLKKVKELYPSTIVVVITAYGSIENAVEAMKLGAFNYLIKPFSPDSIEAVVDKAAEHLNLLQENSYLRQEVSSSVGSSAFNAIGESEALKKIFTDAERIAQSNASVFIYGESGTGKEVVAHLIHQLSPRAQKPFIKVNCAAIPETLIESEFFGHEKGSFTGANQRRIGRFELANGGTLLLDEITEIPPTVQAKLLRAIQEQEFERVGGTKPIKVDVRLISTSNRDMKEAISERVIREDLYYRLNVVPIYIPPLRERMEDILPLSDYFLNKLCRENHKELKKLDGEAKKKLMEYSWPGNVRELANIIERAVVMSVDTTVAPDNLYIDTLQDKPQAYHSLATNPDLSAPGSVSSLVGISLQELEKRLIIETLQAFQNNRSKAASTLGISLRTLRNKLNEYESAKS